ncbi:hypothetical protein L1F06_012785 [Ectopseudomonas hydrolytica]|uniref:Uncharacterized protein n=1 Tax=Ectopseudomonas hydrolytica TaxID=2493633 RepID=A0ABY5A3N0_9GAMM|nr:hypothetical protein [Pseudomonas hydrolytica]USR37573.1 hypothetical protein L1F06_012785 [Pseudomonas hydrolytica]
MTQFQKRIPRARRMLESVGSQYPGAWKQFDAFRADRGKGLPDWPDWCFMPIAAGYAIASGGGANRVPLERVNHPAVLTALATWRMTQGIFRFDETLRAALLDTPLSGGLPTQHLFRLPHWCVYVETEGLTWSDIPLEGFFAHLEYDIARGGTPELRLLLDVGGDPRQPFSPETLLPVPIVLSAADIESAVELVNQSAREQATALGVPPDIPLGLAQPQAVSLAPLISLLLYLCAEPDVTRKGSKVTLDNPQPTRTRRDGWKLFPADGPMEIDVGARLGAALRTALDRREEMRSADAGTGKTLAPHMRAQHWHSFWSGPKFTPDGSAIPQHLRKLDVRWMPPIPVNIDDPDNLTPTIRPVR